MAAAESRPLGDDLRRIWSELLAGDETARGDEARERAAALDTLLGIADDLAERDPAADRAAFLAELERRAVEERAGAAAGAAGGVELATYHRAKGLEWDAVFLPMLEEGSLPIRQALDDDAALEEERRLLYVGITRARTHLALSWAEQRESRGRDARRRPSRFLESIAPRRGATPGRRASGAAGPGSAPRSGRRVVELGDAFAAASPGDPARVALFEALRAWRARRAREDGTAAFIVAHDSTLTAIADARPATLTALRRVPGHGPD